MTNPLFQKDIISISEFTKNHIELVLKTARELKANPRNDLLKGKLVGVTFFEGSTRTRLSFETAIQRLGGRVIGFSDATNTSLGKKGETFVDSMRIITSYTDALVIRHHREGAARLAADISPVPVINAGDGANQHPSQTMLDLFSIYETQGRLEEISIAFVGDLKYGRTVHSLAEALSLYNARIYFVSPESLAMPEYILKDLDAHGIKYSIHETLEEVMPKVDILYMTRVQKERFFNEEDYVRLKDFYVLNKEKMEMAKQDMIVLHPLPRVNEISVEVDDDPRAAYFRQVQYGVYVRMALLLTLLEIHVEE